MPRPLRIVALTAALCAGGCVAHTAADPSRLTRADSALVGRVLLAEDRRDATDPSLSQGLSHSDARIRAIAWRAAARIRDSLFAQRDSLPHVDAAPVWPEPAWKVRYRAVVPRRDDCPFIREALSDSAWFVRLRAAALVRASCAGDDDIAATLRAWITTLPADASHRVPGEVSWHGAAHAIAALARLRPADARSLLHGVATHAKWEPRMYAARAAGVASDTATLRMLLRDPNDNVKEAAVDALARLTVHADDALFIATLDAQGAQAVRAAAIALKGSTHPGVPAAAQQALDRFLARANDSERDARLALLELLGRPASADRAATRPASLPADAVALALGGEARLRVAMAPAYGGRSFVVRLRGDVAPIMAARVLALARAGYYDNSGWHRAEHDFVLQGLGPGSNEYVGYRAFFRDEPGTIPHPRGTVGMSTRGHDSGDAQWFINLRDNPRLIRDFTVFAEVVEGMDVVDAIMEGDIVASIREVGRKP